MKHYNVKCEIKYFQPYLPPRCRKYRYEQKVEEIKLPVRMITSEDAPIAFRLSDYGHTSEGYAEIRCYKHKLYKQMRRWTIVNCQDEERLLPVKPEELKIVPYYRCRDKREECVNECKQQAKRWLIIDGVVWERCGEPRYVVNTFGLGHNHGGTGLFVDEWYNPNIANTNYFSALDGKKAVEYANQVAQRRGDTKDVGRFKEMIEVLMPECVKIKPIKEHGEGDKFINSLKAITERSDSAAEAGLLAVCLALSNS